MRPINGGNTIFVAREWPLLLHRLLPWNESYWLRTNCFYWLRTNILCANKVRCRSHRLMQWQLILAQWSSLGKVLIHSTANGNTCTHKLSSKGEASAKPFSYSHEWPFSTTFLLGHYCLSSRERITDCTGQQRNKYTAVGHRRHVCSTRLSSILSHRRKWWYFLRK